MNIYPSFRFVSLAFAVIFLLSGCSSSSDDGGNPDVAGDAGGGDGNTDAATDNPPGKVRATIEGEVYTNEEGKTLYTFNSDSPGVTNCTGGCADSWPPLHATDAAGPQGRFSVISRDDGTKQWALDGMPLYTWINDSAPGDTTGEGVNDLWFVAQTAPVSKFNTPSEGVVITDTRSLTLYVLDNETSSNLVCRGSCLTAWPPMLGAADDIDRGDYTLFTNGSGDKQWAFKDKPLYLWKDDVNPGDVNGQGLAHPSGGTWVAASKQQGSDVEPTSEEPTSEEPTAPSPGAY